jgi:hypothetical protein
MYGVQDALKCITVLEIARFCFKLKRVSEWVTEERLEETQSCVQQKRTITKENLQYFR